MSLRSFVIAGAITAAAVGARAALDLALPALPPFITLYPAVALAGLLCGPAAAASASLAGLAAAIFLWIPPRMSFVIPSLSDSVGIALFVAASAIMLWVAALFRAQLEAATVSKFELELGLDAGGVGAWQYDLRTGSISASATAFRLHGLPPDGSQNGAEDWLRGVSPDDAAVARARLRAAVADGTLAAYTYRVLGAENRPRWISSRGKVVEFGGERRLLCALVDVTESMEMQDELRRERERLRLALEAGSLAVWDFSPDTGVATIDVRYAATMGFETGVSQLTMEEIGERIHPEDIARVGAEHDAAVARGTDYLIEFRIRTPSGDIRWVASQGILLTNETMPAPRRMVGIIQDITERRRREDRLRELAAARELLVREADHRIKNSLQLVIALLTVQLRGVADPGARDALRGAIARVGAIAASHLALQRSDDLKAVDFAAMLRDLCEHFRALRPEIAIVCRPTGATLLDADRAIPLGLVVSELLTNALRHAFAQRDSGTVTVDASIDTSHLLVRISDDGVGMLSRSEPTGLGSNIVRALSTQLDATLEIDSVPDVGTVVVLRLPLLRQGREIETSPARSAG